MMQTRLITVEGLYGAGKSTLAHYLVQQLALNHQSVQWIDEYHLVVPFFADFYVAFQQGTDGLEVLFLNGWRNVAAQLAHSEQTFVLDGALFTNSFFRLLASGLELSAIQACADALRELLSPFRPRICYLARDSQAALDSACATRGPRWTDFIIEHTNAYPYQRSRQRSGWDGVAAFFAEAQDLFLTLLPRLSFSTHLITTTAGEWDTYQHEMVTALGLTPVPIVVPTIPKEILATYVGTYDGPATFPGTPAFEVAWREDSLVFQTTFSAQR